MNTTGPEPGSGSGAGAGAEAAAAARSARYAALEAREKKLFDEAEALEEDMKSVEAAHEKAFTTWAQLKGQLKVLQLANHGEQSAEAKALASNIASAKEAFDKAAAKLKRWENAIERKYGQLKRVQSLLALDDMQASAQDGAGAGAGDKVDRSSTKHILAGALTAVQELTHEELKAQYKLEAGEVWTAGYLRIMIRKHYPVLFRSMCKNANVHTIGDDAAWQGSFTGGHALLRGTAGTGKSAFMFVMFIEFLKMCRAPPGEKAVEVDGVVVFNPAVDSIIIQWDGINGGNALLVATSVEKINYRRLVHLYDAGVDAPVRKLPGSQGQGYFLATSSANPAHYSSWDSKQLGLKRQYSVLWSVEELLELIKLKGDAVNISKQELYDRYAVVGGVPRLILGQRASDLLATVRKRVKSITMEMVRAVIQNDAEARERLLFPGTGTTSFSMFAMDVKAEGDFDDVQVKFLTPTVAAEFYAHRTTTTVSQLKAELSDELKRGTPTSRTTYENIAAYHLAHHGFDGTIRVLTPEGTAQSLVPMKLPPCPIRHYVNAEHLARLVLTDLENGQLRMYIPMALNNPLVDAWCICTVNHRRVVVGLQVTVAKLLHPIAGEDVAKEHFNAIHASLAKHETVVNTAAWVVFALPAANFPKFPYQHAKVAPGKEQRRAGLIWPHTQAKLSMALGDDGNPAANLGEMRDMLAQGTAIELSAATTIRDMIRTLHNMGRKRAAQLRSVLRDKTRDEAKTAEDFLDSLENSHRDKVLARVLKHEDNQGRWAYRGRVWSEPVVAPTKRTAPAADGADVVYSAHGRPKRARRGRHGPY